MRDDDNEVKAEPSESTATEATPETPSEAPVKAEKKKAKKPAKSTKSKASKVSKGAKKKKSSKLSKPAKKSKGSTKVKGRGRPRGPNYVGKKRNPAKVTKAKLAFGRKLARARAKEGVTQSWLAERLDMYQSTIANVESGRSGFSEATLKKVQKLLSM